jgi:hypothetical protein
MDVIIPPYGMPWERRYRHRNTDVKLYIIDKYAIGVTLWMSVFRRIVTSINRC